MCTELESIDIPNARTIQDGAFDGCENLKILDTPNLVMLGNNALQDCSSLQEIDISSVATMGYNALQNCESLVEIDAPCLVQVGDNCMRGCKKLEKFNALRLQTIGEGAFYNCISLKHARFPLAKTVAFNSSGESSAGGAFQGCSNLEVAILSSVKSLQQSTFQGCSDLEYVSTPIAPTTGFPTGTFASCVKLKWLVALQVPPGYKYQTINSFRSMMGISPSCGISYYDGAISKPTGAQDPK